MLAVGYPTSRKVDRMAISKKAPIKMDDDPMTIAVTVEHVIGELDISPDNMGTPTLIAGLQLIGEYEYDHTDGGKYRIPMPDGSTLVADLTYEGKNQDRDSSAM
jgi:hypothetical protein